MTVRMLGTLARARAQLASLLVAVLGAAAALAWSAPASAQETTEPVEAGGHVSVELNKLEQTEQGCRSYFVMVPEDVGYDALQLSVVIFDRQDVISSFINFDLAPLSAGRMRVITVVFPGTECSSIGSMLVNEVISCRSDAQPIEDCIARLSFTSLADVVFR